MQATTTGHNRTGAAVSPDGVQAMTATKHSLRNTPPCGRGVCRLDASGDRPADHAGPVPHGGVSAELTDGAGWELLIQLTEQGGHDELTGKRLAAHGQEVQHQQATQGWLSSLLLAEKATALV